MNKFELIKSLDEMEKYHRIQYKKVKGMMNGIETTNPTPIFPDECDFGIWILSKNEILTDVLGSNFYIQLKSLHNMWHEYYASIYDCFYIIEKKRFFSKEKLVFNKNLDSQKQQFISETYAKLEHTSTQLFKHIDICRKRMYALPEENYL